MKNIFYYPILKWKQGEYTALSKLAAEVKDRVCPIIEITQPGFDSESKETRKTIEAHTKDIGIRLHKAWEDRYAFVDISNIGMNNEQKMTYIPRIFNNYRDSFCIVAPVVYLNDGDDCLDLYKDIIAQRNIGCVLRVKFQELNNNFQEKVNDTVKKLGIDLSSIDLLIDMEKLTLSPEDEQETYDIWSEELLKVSSIAPWRSLIIAGSSFPEGVVDGNLCNRYEWKFYKDYIDKLPRGYMVPKFSDYYVLKPKHPSPVDGKKIKSTAKLRYTTDDGWYFDKALPQTKNKKVEAIEDKVKINEKYRTLCEKLIISSFFRGKDFSVGDKYMFDRATNKNISPGGPTQWIEASTNQHITKVVVDLSNLFDFSLRPLRGLLALLEKTLG